MIRGYLEIGCDDVQFRPLAPCILSDGARIISMRIIPLKALIAIVIFFLMPSDRIVSVVSPLPHPISLLFIFGCVLFLHSNCDSMLANRYLLNDGLALPLQVRYDVLQA
jgi:hypothetical protein